MRSGNYEQGRGSLHKDGLYCCLGVLCEVTEQERVMAFRHRLLPQQPGYKDSEGEVCFNLPTGIMCEEWGLEEMFTTHLANRNDGLSGKPWSFEQIAREISKRYL